MRLSIGALFATSLAVVSGLAVPPLGNQTDELLLTQQGVTIPITSIKCTGYDLDPFDVIKARNKLAEWGIKHGKVPGKSMHKERSGDVVWYVCNCKWIHKDGLAMEELAEAENQIFNKCGQFRSGYLWSHHWEKMYDVQPMDWVNRLPQTWHWCPRDCVFDEVKSDEVSTLNSTES